MIRRCDYLVIGSGVAGLLVSIKAASQGSVILVTKRGAEDSATRDAQGGVASVFGDKDSFESHIADTLTAGAGLCDPAVVDFTVREGPERIRELVGMGADFSRHSPGGDLDLGREGGHSARRIVHAADHTGAEISRVLLAAARTSPDIEILERHAAVDLVVPERASPSAECLGAFILTPNGEVVTVLARATILATGGAGKVYLYTSNPDVATGDGIAMAFRAGAEVANLEFIQFHPTCLFHPHAKSFLISERVRGEGGILKDHTGRPFMKDYDPRAELAPRDIVARAIDSEMKRSGADSVYLDATPLGRDFLDMHFPYLTENLASYGIDMAAQPIPVVPAVHYFCGGVSTDHHGRTTLPRLLAVGETAFTGLHGANRLASNSLLEGLVFAHRAAGMLGELAGPDFSKAREWETGNAAPSRESVVVSQDWDEIRRFMWNYVGIMRSEKRLERARRRMDLLAEEIREYYWNVLPNLDLIELRNIATVADLVIHSATLRKESRGLHWVEDYPSRNDRVFACATRFRRFAG